MHSAPKSVRVQIGLFGRTNVGKSSFLNLLVGQEVAITSEWAGTTTDVVEKPMELLPIGPVVFLDTAGLDDRSGLAGPRLGKTELVFDRADVTVLIAEPDRWTAYEERVLEEAARRASPCMVVVNKMDRGEPCAEVREGMARSPLHMTCSCRVPNERETVIRTFKDLLRKALPEEAWRLPTLVGDVLPPGGLAVFVVPIDLQAPKGRLILPQVQALRDALDNDAAALVVKESEYSHLLTRLSTPPDLVVCDSQVILKVATDTPPEIPCTTFSILFARFKGDLVEAARGAALLERLAPGDRVLVAEACSHHAMEDDIGRVKIPRWLRQYAGTNLAVDVYAGRDYPAHLKDYRVIVHCGACMLTRREMLARMRKADEAGVPVTNYGVCIAFVQGVLERALSPFPAARDAYRDALSPPIRRSVP